MPWHNTFRGDLRGALSAAIITLPMSIGYGILAFSPLGWEFAPKAALLGVYSAVFGGIIAGVFGGTPIQITGPKAPVTLVLATFAAGTLSKLTLSTGSAVSPEIIIGLSGVCVMTAGVCQLALGVLNAGRLAKYVPRPVIAGFMNGVAVLLIVKQIRPILGIGTGISLMDVIRHPDLINPLPLAAGLATIVAIFSARRRIKAVPASLVALLVGSAMYYGLKYAAGDQMTGRVIGRLDVGLPSPYAILGWLGAGEKISYSDLLPELMSTGFILGLVASMESLLAAVVADNLTGERHDGRKELIGQGLGNIVCGLFGALPAAGSIPRSMANYRAGGRTPVSGVLCAVIIFLMVVFMAPAVGGIPLAVVAGIVFFVGVTLFDRWSLDLLWNQMASLKFQREALVDISIMLIVAIFTVVINLITAVAVGILIASAMFIGRVGRSIVKCRHYGNQLHSRKMRSREQAEMLEEMGGRIVVIDLQGPLFFGSAENLAVEIEGLTPQTRYCILNFNRVNDMDSTGAKSLSHIKNRLHSKGIQLLISHLRDNQLLADFLEVMCKDELKGGCFIFGDTDEALEWAEDHLLSQAYLGRQPEPETELSRVELFRDFSKEELEVLESRLDRQHFTKGQLVLNEGDPSRDLYLLTKGAISVKIHLPGNNRQRRVLTFTSLTPFGEMSFLDGNRRSASVWAQEDSEALRLRFSRFEVLSAEHPQIAAKLITNLSRELTRRLRMTSDHLRLLQDN